MDFDIFPLVRQHLLTYAPIAALVGTRIAPAPPGQAATYPLITLQEISDVAAGPLKGRASVADPRYQVDCWTKDVGGNAPYSEVRALARLVKRRMEGFNGRWPDTSVSPTQYRIVAMRYSNGFDSFEQDVNGGYRRRSMDFFIQHQTGNG